MKKFFSRPLVIVILIIVIIAVVIMVSGRSAAPAATDIATVVKADIIQEVGVTGTVKATRTVELGFEKTGTISRAYAQVGDSVAPGQALAVLEHSEADAQLAQAEADLKVQEAKVGGAVAAVEDAKKNLADKIGDAYTKADTAVRSSADQFFSNPRTSSSKLLFRVNNAQLQIDVESQRFFIESTLIKWQAADVDANLVAVKHFLDTVWLALNGAVIDASVSQGDIDGWKIDLSAAQASINAAISNMTAAREKLQAAQSDLTVNQAQIDKASANRDYYASVLRKSIIRSPITAIVTRQDAKAGEIAPANSALISLISAGQYEIEANVPESDIAKVKMGDKTRVTLDAYGSATLFTATVSSIDPAETMVDGVATYKVKFQFSEKDERVRSGMTANIDIVTAKHEGVLTVPQRAVASKGGQMVVVVVDGTTKKEVQVQTGLRGIDGTVEIVSGLTEGQQVQLTLQ